jgi:cytochrome oxidase Cu insertion factor (SCO1/SenC/PrrC family)
MRLRADDQHPEQGSAAGQVPTGTGQREPASTGRQVRRDRHRLAVIVGAMAVLLAAAAATSAFLVARPATPQAPRVSGLPANIPTSLANLMELSPLPTARAPGFTFTDQGGHTMSLADLRGKVVVLEFMDPHCTDICPLVSQEFVDAYHDLGPLADKVVFAAVNVNQYYRSVRAVAAFSREHGLTTIPRWHFFTGPVPALRATWRAYGIAVEAPNPNADIVHTSAIYFIDANGAERYLASPQVDHTAQGASYLAADQLATWGRAIATLARDIAH